MKLIFVVLTVIFANNIHSQSILVNYEVNNLNKVTKTELVFNDTISIFNVLESKSDNKGNPTFFIKNKNEKTAYFNERIINQNMYVKDSIYIMKWELLSDTLTILNEKCLSAKTTFRGRQYTAFYAPKFSVDEGPWKFGGLPGLILSIKSDDNFIEWKAIKLIENYSPIILIPKTNKYKFVGWSDFVKMYKLTIENFIKSVRSNGTMATESKAKMKVDNVEIFYPELQTGEGINY